MNHEVYDLGLGMLFSESRFGIVARGVAHEEELSVDDCDVPLSSFRKPSIKF